ncbi:MAG TPA: hypothetical protein VLU94_01120, partial [Candidatus Nitrosotalea sp.]|nr:hypothetical protein [Candidatus Nitrosotalea sp.]
ILDQSLASGWGLSGDGNTLVGLYWRSQPCGSAHPSRWTQATGAVALGTECGSGSFSTLGSGRANAANYDGSVVVGWIENPQGGNWWPAVWVNGVRTTLRETEGSAEAQGVSSDGTMIVGSSWFPPIGPFSVEEAAIWRWTGSQWVEQRIGKLPGTASPFGLATANGVTADKSMVVGYNQFSSPSNATGFIWTQQDGMVNVVDYLASQGVSLPPSFTILSLSAISEDGSVIIGIGQYTIPPYEYQSFRITRCARNGDMNKDGFVNGLDIAGFIRAKLGQTPAAGENAICADYGGTLDEDTAAFTADLLGS